MAASPRLVVVLAGRVVAEVGRTRAGVLRLTYTSEARAPGAMPLSLSLPTDTGSVTGERVRWFLDALLPDNEAARRAIARRHAADADDVLSLLAAVGKDCAGAVQLCTPEDVSATLAREGALVALSDADVEMRLAELRTDEDASWTMAEEHWSLGGSQQKFAVRRMAGNWYEATGAEPTSHIVKPGIRRLQAQALIEHVSMRAAALCGVDVAHTEYMSFKSESAIVITRFDRAADVAGGLCRLHQEDLCQSLGVPEKYESEGGPTAQDVVRLLRDASATPADARENVRRFIDALVYNTVIAAPDAHARNYAVLLDGERVHLAPAFDVATGLAYAPPPEGRSLSMSVGGVWDAEKVDTAAWRRLARENRLDPEALLVRVREIAERVPRAVTRALDEVDELDEDWDGSVASVRERLLPRLGAHVAALLERIG
ncbi:HipA domain-containing protein [Cellulosimicrobium cellulans]|uniref:HipA domain-containing protein n=1 Tax=Cellulosimicrobium cellulans TaxID=1710 RepID=UPI002404CF79|nr:HipA domain-containing protein [Cellulosimicrobium cellulans]MDF9875267.1 serine/threonine-protein kinase HipA [Cellulosimicrobium cellulans]